MKDIIANLGLSKSAVLHRTLRPVLERQGIVWAWLDDVPPRRELIEDVGHIVLRLSHARLGGHGPCMKRRGDIAAIQGSLATVVHRIFPVATMHKCLELGRDLAAARWIRGFVQVIRLQACVPIQGIKLGRGKC